MQTIINQQAFLQLIEENKGIIIKICNAYCQNKNDREDLAQEINYQLWRSIKHFDNSYKFSTWMYRVALNVAISFYRKGIKENVVIPFTDNLVEIAYTNDGNNELENNIQKLQQFIYALKELEKALMILYLESKTYREISDILGITETNVASKISRIKEKLKQQFSTTN